MKKIIALLICLASVLALASCTADEPEPAPVPTAASTDAPATTEVAPADYSDVDLDLTALSSTMVYSEVYNMVNVPQDYMGKTVKARGPFAIYEDPASGYIYYAVIIKDATACCSSGLEFILTDDLKYPDDYPALGTEITVSGVFGVYYEGNTRYPRLNAAVMEVGDAPQA